MLTNCFRGGKLARMPIGVLTLAAALLFSTVPVGFAQETTGQIDGTVKDSSGAAIPDARIEITGTGLPRARSISAGSNGYYLLSALPPGSYTLVATAKGFGSVKQADINLLVGQKLTIDLPMQVGAVSESVLVSANAVIVDTTQSQVATNITQEFYDRLPKGRTFDSLLALAPGTRPESKGGGYSIDGASGSENIYVLDGMDITNLQSGVLPKQSQAPIEAVQEVQVKSSGFEAQYGGAVGGVVNAVIKSGSNEYHGQVSLYTAFDSLNAASRGNLTIDPNDSNNITPFRYGQKKDGYTNLNPVIDFGGRIVRDKLWFFVLTSPQFETIDRTVTFLSNGATRSFEEKSRTDFSVVKLDYAPLSKVRTTFTYLYSPFRNRGLLPGYLGDADPTTPFASEGNRSPGASYIGSIDYTATSRLVLSFRGGYNYRNYKDYGIPSGVQYYANSATTVKDPSGNILPIPAQFQGPTGFRSPVTTQTVKDIQSKLNYQADASYILNLAGTHNIKGGYQYLQLSNDAAAGVYPQGYVRAYYGQSYVTANGGQSVRGLYGYYRVRQLGTLGSVSSTNNGLYIQDNWKVNRRLTLNIGLRTEQEVVPSFRVGNGYPSDAIKFPFGDKLAPRLGAAYDLFGNSKVKIYGSFGIFYDIMKYELPRGSFGGDIFTDTYYALDNPDYTKLSVTNHPGQFLEFLDRRIPSNDPNNNLVDKNLKPVKQRAIDAGVDYTLTDKMVVGARFVRKDLLRTIEDVGLLTPLGETYFITNPGYGYSIDTVKLNGFRPTPKADREYTAIELRLERRFARNFIYSASYTYSHLYGNYSGLASSDENGRNSPNVNRYFDLPWTVLDDKGKAVYGDLATDRPSTFKFFGSYTLNSKIGTSNFAPVFLAYSGTPLTTEVSVGGVPMYVNGRGDIGRTPFFTNTNFQFYQEFKLAHAREGMKVRFEFNVLNLFNQATPTNYLTGYNDPNLGGGNLAVADYTTLYNGFDYKALTKANGSAANPSGINPLYKMASEWQAPRAVRLGFHFIF